MDASSQIRAFGQELEMTQWLSPQQLRDRQAPLLAKLLSHARRTTKFYRERLAFNLRSRESIDKLWSEIPVLTRAEVVKNRCKLVSRKVPPESGSVRDGQTSGSTGTPLDFKNSSAGYIVATALTERMFRWWSVDGAKSLALIAADTTGRAAPPDGVTHYGWYSSNPGGIRYHIGLRADIDTYLNWLMARRPDYLGTYPPILKELASTVQERGIELKLAQLLSFGTALDQETRDVCQAAFGAAIADTYGAQEVDHVAAQCPDCGEYHISAEATIVEVLRADESAAKPGEIGRVVVTPLYNYAMPFIRYELGDMAEVGASPSACGRGLPTLRRILGRARNLFRFRDGTVAWPIAANFKLRDFIEFRQFQVVQTDLDHIEIRYVPKASERPIDMPALTQRVRTVLRQPVNVAVRSVDQIDRLQSGKYEDCISLVSRNGIG